MRTTKRRFLLGAGTLATGGIALAHSSDNARAEVTMDKLTVPDDSVVTTSDIQDVLLEVTGTWDYSGNITPDRWECTLKAGNAPDTTHPLATVSEADIGKEGSGGFTLTGSLLDSPHYDMSNFALARAGNEKSTPFVAEIKFKVFKDRDVVAQASATDSARITVTREQVRVDANISAEGGVTVQESE